ncbi:MAG: hypothetical protein L3J24_06565 [Xanthomonadales bacterium]|nr:hypothetical protein [Xanthomonadales bacterium]
MPTRKIQYVLLTGLVVVLLGGFYFYMAASESEPVAAIVLTNETDVSVGQGKINGSEKSLPKASKAEPDTKRIRGNKADGEPTSEVHALLDIALSGDTESAIEFQQRMLECRGKNSLVNNAKQTAGMMAKLNKITRLPVLGASSDEFLAKAENRKYDCDLFFGESTDQKNRHDTSRATNENIQDSLEAEAEQGNTVARFLYAMAAPSDRESFLIGPPILDYEQKALEYTLLNKSDNPQLSLLAFGLSYTSTSEGYFTTKRTSLGTAYLVAAQLCGLYHPVIEEKLELFAKMKKFMLSMQMGEPTSDKEIVLLAELIATDFCP